MPEATDQNYQRGDIRKLLRLALAMEDVESPSLNNLARETGFGKQALIDDIKRMQTQLGMTIEKQDFCYSIRDWGPVLRGSDSAREFLGLNKAIASGQ